MNLRTEARGKPCMVRLPGCDGGGETTVLAHYRLAGYCGTGMKPPDELAAWACWSCHERIDGRNREFNGTHVRLAHAEGVLRTIAERAKDQPKPAPKPKKRKTPFNTFDAEPKSKTMQRNSHKAALRYATGIKA